MLKQPIRIFQITGKEVLNDKVIRFFLHADLNGTTFDDLCFGRGWVEE